MTQTSTSSPTGTVTQTRSSTGTTTQTFTSTQTPSLTETSTPTSTPSPTGTNSPSSSETSTLTPTGTASKTSSQSPVSKSPTPSITLFPSAAPPIPSKSPNPEPIESTTSTVTPTATKSPFTLCGSLCDQVPDDEVIPIVDEPDESMDIISEENNIGTVTLPPGTNTAAGFLIITQAIISNDTDISQVLSPIVELTLLDSSGNEISILENSVELCLEVDPSAGEVCVSSYFPFSFELNVYIFYLG